MLVSLTMDANEKSFVHGTSRENQELPKSVDVCFFCFVIGWENTFLKLNWKAVDTMRLPYDYSSIMHYPFNAFSKNSRKRTIVPLKPVKARPYRRLSHLDILRTNIMYSCSSKSEFHLIDSGCFKKSKYARPSSA
jgi:hypothetical protein